MYDCVIVGGGPAGLSAAIYLARFRLKLKIFDAGGGRALSIPLARNVAGFPGGISGVDLVGRMEAQAREFGVVVVRERVTDLVRLREGFAVQAATDTTTAATVLLACGVTNLAPSIDGAVHAEALRDGYIRYCPICDGFEVTDKRVAVIGSGISAAREAIFLRSYTTDTTLILSHLDIPSCIKRQIHESGIEIRVGLADDFKISTGQIRFNCAGEWLSFDTIYPALGSRIHSELAGKVGADLSEEGCIIVDKHQRTSVAGLYAAGDVVRGLDQIGHAIGEAGVAATAVRNDLAVRRPLRR
ncbi:NAD(P)/FAD-dependent oxidoreductase [Chelatococcus reniformis]|uniref:Thioredoxin reductase n=1 Tax=Chelatococcus reniformis TaxID=1494448 RepID=A0A916XL70_9HYPH|nr:NAD(P)/FAD-dependent oxidoreductase [Chelatococcus reniformis]GGC83027.1 pyridine nucleotide-disulfide oxidoreductase [Chelatococcus reniformis]